jgi:hypothetical protein
MLTRPRNATLAIVIVLMLTLLLSVHTAARPLSSAPPAVGAETQPEKENPQTPTGTVFFDNFEGDVSGWTTTGFWHRVTNPQNISVYHTGPAAPEDPPNDINPDLVTLPDTDGSGMAYLGQAFSGQKVFWYGVGDYGCFIDPAGNFDPETQTAKNGARSNIPNSGSLTSPSIDLTSASDASLHFWTWWEIEGVDANLYDLMFVEISTDDGGSFTTLGTLNPLNDVNNEHHENYSSLGSKATPGWVRPSFDLSAYAGDVVRIRFHFDTVDEQYNGFRGWMIDDVTVDSSGIQAPEIYGIVPSCVEVAALGTELVRISGANFDNGASVTVNGTAAASVSVLSSARIQILLPASLSAGTYDVTVRNPDGQSDTLSDAVVVSDDPCLDVECPGVTIRSAWNGDWQDPTTWDLNRVPKWNDVVLIQADHIIDFVPPADTTSPTRVEGLCNYGELVCQCHRVSARSIDIKPPPPGEYCRLKGSGYVLNQGLILGVDGSARAGSQCGEPGCGWKIWGVPFDNHGTIRAGNGGNGDQCGGLGGSLLLIGRDTTNTGFIMAGDGGDVTGVGAGQGGDGGMTDVWGKYLGPGFLLNTGFMYGGDGGNGNPAAAAAQPGGEGGWLQVVSQPSVMLQNGVHAAGSGGQGTGGGANGKDGRVNIEPDTIALQGGEMRVSGGDVVIFGGDDWLLDLRNLSNGAIAATQKISIAVGSGGQVDLRENSGQVLQAGDQVFIYADDILLDPGVDLTDVAGDNVTASGSRILYEFSLAADTPKVIRPGTTFSLPLLLLNYGPKTDTYSLEVSDSAGWDLGPLLPPVEVDGIGMKEVELDITPPSDATTGDKNSITVIAKSEADPDLAVETGVEVSVGSEGGSVYLPLVLRSYTQGPLFYDDFGDSNSGWPIDDTSSYAHDYDNGNYRIQIKDDYLFVWAPAPNFACSDCAIEVEAWRSAGGNSLYSLVFGLDNDVPEFYAFNIQPYLQLYALRRYSASGWVDLIPYTESSHINFDTAHNRLRVERQGSDIRLYVNDQYLASYTDSTFTGPRQVGVAGISTIEYPVWLRYDDFTVWGPGYGASAVTEMGIGVPGAVAAPSEPSDGD